MKLLLLKLTSLALVVTSDAQNLNRIDCKWDSRNTRNNILQRCERRNDGRNWPYSCADGRQVCCTESYINEPTLDNFGGTCRRVPGGPSAPVRPHPSPMPPSSSHRNSIECTAPNQRRIREEGHRAVCRSLSNREVPYACDTGRQLCCNRSNMKTATFDRFGTCHQVHFPNTGDEDVEDTKMGVLETEDGTNLLDLGAHIQCNFGGQRPCGNDKLPYECDGEEKACCTISGRHELMRKVEIPGHGMCEREDDSSDDCAEDGETVGMNMYKDETTGEQTDSSDLAKLCCSGYVTDETATSGTGLDENGKQWYSGTWGGVCAPKPKDEREADSSDCVEDGESVGMNMYKDETTGEQTDSSDLAKLCCSGYVTDETATSGTGLDENGKQWYSGTWGGVCAPEPKDVTMAMS